MGTKNNIVKEKKGAHKKKKLRSSKQKKKISIKEKVTNQKISNSNQKPTTIQDNYSTNEDYELNIPSVPEPPKKKDKITVDSPELSKDVLRRIKKIDSPNIKVVLVNCERCGAVIPIPVPKGVVINSELPIVPISYVHTNLQKNDQHCITLHLDHDFDIRRQRLSDVVISKD
ncbi:MAG: hypothetical protein ACXABO_11425 [Promethearchaeota archaeon]